MMLPHSVGDGRYCAGARPSLGGAGSWATVQLLPFSSNCVGWSGNVGIT